MAARTKPPSEEVKALAKRIRSVDEVSPYVKVLVYGANGTGKTRFAASAPNCLIVDINEEGTRSAVGTGSRVLEVRNWKDVGDAYWYLKSGKHKYESVAIDTITGMQELAMSFVLGEAEDRDPTREKSMPDKRSYGRAGQLVKGMLLAYRNLPMHVIFTAQERNIRDDDTGETVDTTVDLPAGSRGTAMGSVGVLGNLTTKEVRVKKHGKSTKRWMDHLLVGPHEVIRTKDRTNGLGHVVRNPTVPIVIKAWEASPPSEEDEE